MKPPDCFQFSANKFFFQELKKQLFYFVHEEKNSFSKETKFTSLPDNITTLFSKIPEIGLFAITITNRREKPFQCLFFRALTRLSSYMARSLKICLALSTFFTVVWSCDKIEVFAVKLLHNEKCSEWRSGSKVFFAILTRKIECPFKQLYMNSFGKRKLCV